MPTDVQYALMAANAYATKLNVTSEKNAIPTPTGFSQLRERINDQTGFMARAYANTTANANEIVIAYTGTTNESDGASDWTNGNLPLAYGGLGQQLVDAVKFYLDVRKQNLDATIRFTGHSMGGGLASLVSVFFNEEAVTFDEAPFGNAAVSDLVVTRLRDELSDAGYTGAAGYELSALTSYDPLRSLATRQANVHHIYLKDEALSLMQDPLKKALLVAAGSAVWPALGVLAAIPTPNIKGSEEVIVANVTNGNGWGWPLLNGQPVDLHDMVLLTGYLQSRNGFLKASQDNPEVLQKIFTSELTRLDAFGTQQRFLNLMVQQEAQGNGSWSAFAGDIVKLTGEIGASPIKAALVGLDIGMHYGQGMDRVNGVASGAFESVFKSVTGGIQFVPKTEHSEWLFDSLGEFRRKLPTLYADIGAAGSKFTESAERYMLPTSGAMNVTAAGDGKSDFMLGSINADTFAGSDGGDVLLGRAGADTLDGGSGWDTLVGGKDDDNLNGGTGFDRYLYNLGDGSDFIEDGDGGSIQIFGNYSEYVFGGLYIKQQGSDTWIGEASNHIVTIQRAGDWIVSSDDGATVRFAASTNLGAFAMKLVDDQLAAPVTSRTLTGDYQPLDFDLTKDGIQTQTDDLGNIILDATKPAPGRADYFEDSTGNDIIQGFFGDDFLNAWRGGDDRIDGGEGNDWLFGGAGNDLVEGGFGRDVLIDASGNDRLYADGKIDLDDALALENEIPSGAQGEALSGGAGDDLAIGGVGNDVFLGGTGDDILVAGSGDDTIDGDAMASNITSSWNVIRSVSTSNGVTSYNTTYDQFSMTWSTNGGADTIYAGAGADWVFGGYGNDYVDGGNDSDVLFGEGGNDDLFGGSGNDRIFGDTGSIPLSAHGDDYLDGEDGDDVLTGGGGQDRLFGGIGTDQLYGNDGDDYVDGEDGADVVVGGAGNDELFGGADADFLQGDAGNGVGDGADYLDGEAGNDILLGLGGGDTLHGGDGDDQIAGDNGGYDTSGAADTIYGEAGNDLIDGQGGDDVIDGGADNDIVAGGLGNDQITGGMGYDQLQGGEGNDVLDGGSEGDTLFGEAGNDTLLGGAGNDYLIGGLGDDLLNGGDGDDVYFLASGEGRDRIVDSGGIDWLVFNNILWGQLRLGTGSLKISLPDGSEIHLDDFDPDNPFASGGIEYFQFADNTVMSKNQLINALGIQPTGTTEADVLSGTALSESIAALAGDDVVTARAGNDTVLAGDGADVAYGGDGNDILYGGNGDDVLLGEAGNDTLHGEAGNDLLAGGAGTDALQGGEGDDTYLFQIGDGQDTATDALGSNAVALGAGLTLDAITFTRQGSDLLVAVNNSTDRLTVRDWFAPASTFATITLGDGTLLDHAGVEAAMPRNQAPLAAADSGTAIEDAITEITGNALANDSDPEGRALRVTNSGIQAGAVGALSLASGGGWSYVLANGAPAVQSLGAGQSLTESFAYTVSDDDPNGAATASSTIRISVLGANDLPVLGADSAATSEDAAAITGNLLSNDSDIDAGTALNIANPGAKVGAYGTLNLAADGAWTYTLANTAAVQGLAAGQMVTESFAHTVSDGFAQVGGTLAIGIAGRNDAPIVATPLADQSAAANTSWSWTLPAGSFSDIDAGDVLSYAATLADGSALPSWLSFSAATQTFSGRVPKSASGSIDLRIAATDRAGASATDVFSLSFASGGGGGGGGSGGGGGNSQGNEGVGNGIDAAPPGHDASFNDGAGTGPGNPGAQGGNGYRPPHRDQIVKTELRIAAPLLEAPAASAEAHGNSAAAHAAAPGQARQAADDVFAADAAVAPAPTIAAMADTADVSGPSPDTPSRDKTTADWLTEAAWAYLDRQGPDAVYQSAPGTDSVAAFAQWLAVEQALARDAADGMPDWLDRSKGADLRGLLAINGGLLGSTRPIGADTLGLLGGAELKTFKGLGEGLQKIA